MTVRMVEDCRPRDFRRSQVTIEFAKLDRPCRVALLFVSGPRCGEHGGPDLPRSLCSPGDRVGRAGLAAKPVENLYLPRKHLLEGRSGGGPTGQV